MNGRSWTPEKFGSHQVGALDFNFVYLYKMLLVSLFVCEYEVGIVISPIVGSKLLGEYVTI